MKFTRLLVMSTEETGEDYVGPTFTYRVGTPFEHNENLGPTEFVVKSIELLENGWVLTESFDDYPEEVFPAWRVIALEGLLDE
jgi:hypothetical protein